MSSNFQVGSWLVEPSLNSVSRNGAEVRLEPKLMEVLVCLAQHPGEAVSKEKLMQSAWSDTFVSEDVLTRSISELRRILEDDARDSHIIQTIPKRGYRLVAAVTPVNGAVLASASPQTPADISGFRTDSIRWRAAKATLLAAVPLLALLVGFNVGGLRDRLSLRSSAPTIQSLAVLPLQNLSGDPAQEYFADGMTEELITELSRLHGLKVISRTSVMRYKKSDKSLPEIARELGVDGIVEGSVLRSGDRVRITAQLIRARTDANLWAGTYDRDLHDVLALQSTVAQAVADQIRVEMTAQDRGRSKAARPVNLRALDAYLQGAYHLNRLGRGFGGEEAALAITSLQQAIAEDPEFAAAYVKLCEAYESQRLLFEGPATHLSQKAAAEKALALDPDSADAHVAVAIVRFREWELPAAAVELRRALQLNQNHGQAHELLADYLDATAQMDEGMREHQLAQAVDPVNDHITNGLFRLRQYDRAIELLRKRLQFNPDDGVLHAKLSSHYAAKNMGKEWIAEQEIMCRLFGFDEVADALSRAFAASGYDGAQREWARQLQRAHDRHQLNKPVMVAEAYADVGERDKAFRWLETAYREHDGDLIFVGINPQWDTFQPDPRFKDLLRRVGLPPPVPMS